MTPSLRSEPQDAGKPPFQITELYGAHQGGKLSTKRPQDGAILRTRVERGDQEDGGTGKRRGYRLRESGRLRCRSGRDYCGGRIGLHLVSSLGASAEALRNITFPSPTRVVWTASLTSPTHIPLLGEPLQQGHPPSEPGKTCEVLDSGRRSKWSFYSSSFRRRRALVITETELKLMAAAAKIGLRSRPKNG